MARRSRPTVSKRQKEMARQQKQQAKQARRLESRRQKGTVTEPPSGEDAQIAEINPGPQPVPDWVREDRGPGGE